MEVQIEKEVKSVGSGGHSGWDEDVDVDTLNDESSGSLPLK